MNFCCIYAISIAFTGLCDLGCLYYLLCGSHALLLILILSLCYSIVIHTCLFVSISTHALMYFFECFRKDFFDQVRLSLLATSRIIDILVEICNWEFDCV